MADPNDNTSADTMVDVEKESYSHPPEDRVHPAPAATGTAEESEKPADEATEGVDGVDGVDDEGSDAANKDALDKGNGGGADLARVPSQAQKLGKKKVLVIMGALCVRSIHSVGCGYSRRRRGSESGRESETWPRY